MGFSRQEYWSGLPFPSPVNHILSELFTMTWPSWVALHSMAHSFIELDKAVVLGNSLIRFLWSWFSFFHSGGNEGKGPPSKGPVDALLHSVPPTLQQAAADPHLHQRLLLLTGKSRSVSRGVIASFSCVLVHTGFSLCPPRVCFPSPVSSVIKSYGLPSQILWRFSVPLPDLQVEKSVMGPRTLLTVGEFLWYNCSAVCGCLLRGCMVGLMATSSMRAYATICVTQVAAPRAPAPAAGHCGPVPPQESQTQVWLGLCGVSGSWCTQGFVWTLWASLTGMGFDSKCDFAPPTILLWDLCPRIWDIFFWWDPAFSCWWLFSSEL